jgi:hypothetical protein
LPGGEFVIPIPSPYLKMKDHIDPEVLGLCMGMGMGMGMVLGGNVKIGE